MAIKNLMIIYSITLSSLLGAQISATDAEFEAQPIGIKDQLENTLQTQLNLPKILLDKDWNEKVIVFMNIDSLGHAFNLRFDKGLNNFLRKDIQKIITMMQFKRTLHLPNEEAPYFISMHLSTNSYRKYKKQKQKLIVKSKLPVDSTLTIFSKADKSPEYYKDGEEGLVNYFIEQLDYPKMAIEQSIEGTVVIDFVVETNGYTSNINVKKSVNGGCTEEAVRLIKETRWQPAEKGGKLVRYKITYPITFSLYKSQKPNQVQSIGQ